MDAKVKPTWMYSRRLQKLITSLRYGRYRKKCKDNFLYLICANYFYNNKNSHLRNDAFTSVPLEGIKEEKSC